MDSHQVTSNGKHLRLHVGADRRDCLSAIRARARTKATAPRPTRGSREGGGVRVRKVPATSTHSPERPKPPPQHRDRLQLLSRQRTGGDAPAQVFNESAHEECQWSSQDTSPLRPEPGGGASFQLGLQLHPPPRLFRATRRSGPRGDPVDTDRPSRHGQAHAEDNRSPQEGPRSSSSKPRVDRAPFSRIGEARLGPHDPQVR